VNPTLPARAALPDAGDRRYAVGAELGRGGMAEVFLADERDLRRPVAVKVMRHDGDPALFLREAQVTAQLEHPNIVPIHDVGVTSEGLPFFTMKVVGGRTLAEVLKQRQSRLDVLLKICDAVAFAHSRGVVHRDLKPANVMVGEFGEVLVMDWGLAKVENMPDARGGVKVAALGESLDGAVVGTPSYMAPEQARGEAADERADVFALGAILYEMLAGVPPHRGRTVMEVLQKAQEGRVERPGGPPELVAIAMKALAAEREARYAKVVEFQTDVRRYLEGREVSARRDPLSTRVVKWIRRNPIPSAAVAAALLAVSIGAAVMKAQSASRAPEHPQAAEAIHENVPAKK
jgi:serine/threonine protein kinase